MTNRIGFNWDISRLRRQTLWSGISMALVLTLMGLFLGLAILAKQLLERARSSVPMKVSLADSFQETQKNLLERELKLSEAVEKFTYVSKEQALARYLINTGDKEIVKLSGGINPLPASYDLQLKPAYIQADSIAKLSATLKKNLIVSEVFYPLQLMLNVRQNMAYLLIIGLVVALLTTLISIYLIFNTLKLRIYAQRLQIRTMQLIGATPSYIRKPFVRNGLLQGLASGILADILLLIVFTGIFAYFFNLSEGFAILSSPGFFLLLIGIVVFGVALGYLGSYHAVHRFLNRSLEELMKE